MRAALLIRALSGCNLGPQPITPTSVPSRPNVHRVVW